MYDAAGDKKTILELTGTKGRIIEVSLKLFAQSGYHAVSVRDIARDVGIKDASIYSHFASKDEILETIVARFQLAFKTSVPDVSEFEKILKVCSARGFLDEGFNLFKKRLEDPIMAWTYLVLIREKFNDGTAARAWEAHRATVIEYVTESFSVMMRMGLIPARDPGSLARLYEYPFFLLIEDYVLKRCRGEDTSDIEREIVNHKNFIIGIIENR